MLPHLSFCLFADICVPEVSDEIPGLAGAKAWVLVPEPMADVLLGSTERSGQLPPPES